MRHIQAAVQGLGLTSVSVTAEADGIHLVGAVASQDQVASAIAVSKAIAGETRVWVPGRCLIFDGQALHEAANLGDTPRILCMVDVDRTALEDAAPD